MSKLKNQRERLHSEATPQSKISALSKKLDTISKKKEALEVQITNSANGISNLKQFITLNQLENQEKRLVKELEQLKYTQSLITSKRNIPTREKDEFDIWAVAENEMKAQETRRALEKVRQTRMDKENDKDLEK